MDPDFYLRAADPETLKRQERLIPSLLEVGLSEQQARAQITRLCAGDIWCG
ncbi:hypothetical protein [Sinomonas terrae]|uniref:Uncharacterized protein n=1 Tax=Sinomonas terrae TaxID=2908838 RepID=A0ABS9TVX8_9MICC|nr:hypothetical protein [Sinomonas terrae]MCH6468530.1 hypothetical protein [Sinomonas terrae]